MNFHYFTLATKYLVVLHPVQRFLGKQLLVRVSKARDWKAVIEGPSGRRSWVGRQILLTTPSQFQNSPD